MTIRASDNYFHENQCPLDQCGRRYCGVHRLLWRDCETAKSGRTGDRAMELGDCPQCEHQDRMRRFERVRAA